MTGRKLSYVLADVFSPRRYALNRIRRLKRQLARPYLDAEANENRNQSPGAARVTLLHPIAKVLLPGATEPVSDLQSRARLLRLLALAQGHFFSTGELAIIFDFGEHSVAPMVKDLRKRLGGSEWAVQSGPCSLKFHIFVDEKLTDIGDNWFF